MAEYNTGLASWWDRLVNGTDVTNNNQAIANNSYAAFNQKYGLDSPSFNYNSLDAQQRANYDNDLAALNAKTGAAANAGAFDGKFNMEGLTGLASTGLGVVNLASGLDNLFGSGRDARKMALSNLEQQMKHNKEMMAEWRKDNAEFDANRKRITESYKA